MKLALLPLAAALLAQPAPAQPGPGVAGAAPKQPGPGIAEAPAVRKTPAPPVYDEAADAKADVSAAVAKAKKEKKPLFVLFDEVPG